MAVQLVVKRTFVHLEAEDGGDFSPCRDRAFSDDLVLRGSACDDAAARGSVTPSAGSTEGCSSECSDTAAESSESGAEEPSESAEEQIAELQRKLAAEKAKNRTLRSKGQAARAQAKKRAEAAKKITTGTTIVVRKLPKDFSRDAFLERLDSEGFKGSYDFVYLPRSFATSAGFGYAIVNFLEVASAKQAVGRFLGASFSDSMQGLPALLNRYRESPVMEENMPDAYKPMVFSRGSLVPASSWCRRS